jgi:hypothetical protein
MAALIRSDLDLPALRISLDPLDFTQAVFQFVRGRATPAEVARCHLRDLGLPDALTGMRPLADHELRVPSRVLDELRASVWMFGPSPMPPENTLWLEFPTPRGCLYVMPWERLLAPLGWNLFRLPNYLVRPQATGQNLEVAICASEPAAKTPFPASEIVRLLVSHYLRIADHRVTLHVFTDPFTYPAVAAMPTPAGQVIVYDPATAASYELPSRTSKVGASARLSSPWLMWIRDALQGRPLDFVHFVTHGYMSGDRGAVAVATAPTVNTDQRLSRFISAAEMNTFMSQVGAWGLVLTGPPHNFSEAGLRELADAVALVRPGIAMTHDADLDTHCEDFGRCLRTVLGQEEAIDRPLPSITCWVHPAFVEFPVQDQADLYLNHDGSSSFLGPATVGALSGQATEAWVASASRAVEMQQVRWLPDSSEETADPAAVTALRNVADLVERHVGRAYPGSTGWGAP